jgi:anti-sigma B factor antagonist
VTDQLLTVTREDHPSGATVLEVAGELDHTTSPRLTDAVDEIVFAVGVPAVLDLSRLTYCDSTGITVLVKFHRRAEASGSRLILAGVGADLMRVFRIVGLDQLFAFRPTAEQAVEALCSREDA